MLIYQWENTGEKYAFRSNFHPSGFLVPPHIHEYAELLWVRSGSMTLSVDGVKYTAWANSVAFIFPNRIHEYTKNTPCDVWCAVFSNDFLSGFFELYTGKIPKNPIVDFSKDSSLLLRLSQTNGEEPIERAGILNLLFAELLRQTEMIPCPAVDDSLFRNSVDYISKHFREDLTLSGMAHRLGYHEKYLSTALHQQTGMNFRTFLATYRVDSAKRMLLNSREPISRIALECGFGSINTFNRVFRSLVGVTPGEYRMAPLD